MICAYQQISHWLAETGTSLGVEFNLSDDGYCRMISEDDIVLTIVAEHSAEMFRIFIDIMPMPLDGHLQVYEALLVMNLDQGYTGGASMALDIPSSMIVLSYIRQVEDTTFTQFSNLIQNLLVIANKIILDLNPDNTKLEELLKKASANITTPMLQV
jgi:hypothetical protein